jgi:hypothetical protein
MFLRREEGMRIVLALWNWQPTTAGFQGFCFSKKKGGGTDRGSRQEKVRDKKKDEKGRAKTKNIYQILGRVIAREERWLDYSQSFNYAVRVTPSTCRWVISFSAARILFALNLTEWHSAGSDIPFLEVPLLIV